MTLAKITKEAMLFLASCSSWIHMCLICGCLWLAGCGNGGTGQGGSLQPNPGGFLELIVERPDVQKHERSDGEVAMLMRVALINKSPNEVEVFFTGKKYESAGGFRVHVDTEVYVPKARLSGTPEYGVLTRNYGLLPGHGRKEFDLLLTLPKDQAQRVLRDSGEMKVVLLVYSIRRDTMYTEFIGHNAVIPGRWSPEKTSDDKSIPNSGS